MVEITQYALSGRAAPANFWTFSPFQSYSSNYISIL